MKPTPAFSLNKSLRNTPNWPCSTPKMFGVTYMFFSMGAAARNEKDSITKKKLIKLSHQKTLSVPGCCQKIVFHLNEDVFTRLKLFFIHPDEKPLRRLQPRRVYYIKKVYVYDFLFWGGSWIINVFENLGNGGSAPGKQDLRVTCPKGKLEFKYFSSPVYRENTSDSCDTWYTTRKRCITSIYRNIQDIVLKRLPTIDIQ